jgi:hypothetical protein
MRITHAIFLMAVLVASWAWIHPRQSEAAPPSLREQLIGTWRLDSRVVRHPDGSSNPDPAYGPEYPVGYVMYDRTGHMAVQFMGRDRPKDHSDRAYDAYFGTYSVNEQTKPATVTHHMEGSLNPENVGKDNVRDLILDGDNLTLVVHTAGPDLHVNRFVRVK